MCDLIGSGKSCRCSKTNHSQLKPHGKYMDHCLERENDRALMQCLRKSFVKYVVRINSFAAGEAGALEPWLEQDGSPGDGHSQVAPFKWGRRDAGCSECVSPDPVGVDPVGVNPGELISCPVCPIHWPGGNPLGL